MEQLEWLEHKACLLKGLHDFYCNQALCDVTIIARDGSVFKAHQVVLAVNSPFFHWIFHGWKQTNETVTEFKTDIESSVLSALLELIYQGEVSVPGGWPWKQKILQAATVLQFMSIVDSLHVETGQVSTDFVHSDGTGSQSSEAGKEGGIISNSPNLQMLIPAKVLSGQADEIAPHVYQILPQRNVYQEDHGLSGDTSYTDTSHKSDSIKLHVLASDLQQEQRVSYLSHGCHTVDPTLVQEVDQNLETEKVNYQTFTVLSGQVPVSYCSSVFQDVSTSEKTGQTEFSNTAKTRAHVAETGAPVAETGALITERGALVSESAEPVTVCHSWSLSQLPVSERTVDKIYANQISSAENSQNIGRELSETQPTFEKVGSRRNVKPTSTQNVVSKNLPNKCISEVIDNIVRGEFKDASTSTLSVEAKYQRRKSCKKGHKGDLITKSGARSRKATEKRRTSSLHNPGTRRKNSRVCRRTDTSRSTLPNLRKRKAQTRSKSDVKFHSRMKVSNRKKRCVHKRFTEKFKENLLKIKRARTIRYVIKQICFNYRVYHWLKEIKSRSRNSAYYQCFHCSKRFYKFSVWRLHVLTVHLPRTKSTSHRTQKYADIGQKKKFHKYLPCTECDSVFSLRKTLKFHLMHVHEMPLSKVRLNPELLIACEVDSCHFASIDFSELERHSKTEHPEIKHRCPHCRRPRIFHLRVMLEKHVAKVHGEKQVFRCSSCSQCFIKIVHLQEHERDQHGAQHSVKVFRCDVEGCKYETVRQYFLDKHKQSGHRQHKCLHCNTVLKTSDSLQTHIRTMHLNIKPFLCDVCGAGFAKEPVLRLHVKTKHEHKKDYQCHLCPYGTNVQWYLANHLFHRHGLRADFDKRQELSCPHCKSRHLTKSYLDKHIRNVHDLSFKYTCDVCGKSYKSYSALSTHKKVHQDVEQKCPYCEYSSKTGEHMKMHVRTQHTFKGMKPYGCPYCSYSSAMGGNVRKHVMHKHPGQEVKYNTNQEQILYMQMTEAQMLQEQTVTQ